MSKYASMSYGHAAPLYLFPCDVVKMKNFAFPFFHRPIFTMNVRNENYFPPFFLSNLDGI